MIKEKINELINSYEKEIDKLESEMNYIKFSSVWTFKKGVQTGYQTIIEELKKFLKELESNDNIDNLAFIPI